MRGLKGNLKRRSCRNQCLLEYKINDHKKDILRRLIASSGDNLGSINIPPCVLHDLGFKKFQDNKINKTNVKISSTD
jgi:hypothetical protein